MKSVSVPCFVFATPIATETNNAKTQQHATQRKQSLSVTHRQLGVGDFDVEHLGLGAGGDGNVHRQVAELLDPHVLVRAPAVADGCDWRIERVCAK